METERLSPGFDSRGRYDEKPYTLVVNSDGTSLLLFFQTSSQTPDSKVRSLDDFEEWLNWDGVISEQLGEGCSDFHRCERVQVYLYKFNTDGSALWMKQIQFSQTVFPSTEFDELYGNIPNKGDFTEEELEKFIYQDERLFSKNFCFCPSIPFETHMVSTLDSGILISGLFGCDINLNQFLIKLDEDGNLLWNHFFSELQGFIYHSSVGFQSFVLSDNSILTISNVENTMNAVYMIHKKQYRRAKHRSISDDTYTLLTKFSSTGDHILFQKRLYFGNDVFPIPYTHAILSDDLETLHVKTGFTVDIVIDTDDGSYEKYEYQRVYDWIDLLISSKERSGEVFNYLIQGGGWVGEGFNETTLSWSRRSWDPQEIIKLSEDGMEWCLKIQKLTSHSLVFGGLVASKDGDGIVVYGYDVGDDESFLIDLYLVHISSKGEIVWKRKMENVAEFDLLHDDTGDEYHSISVFDGGYVISSVTQTPGHELLVFHVDNDGFNEDCGMKNFDEEVVIIGDCKDESEGYFDEDIRFRNIVPKFEDLEENQKLNDKFKIRITDQAGKAMDVYGRYGFCDRKYNYVNGVFDGEVLWIVWLSIVASVIVFGVLAVTLFVILWIFAKKHGKRDDGTDSMPKKNGKEETNHRCTNPTTDSSSTSSSSDDVYDDEQ